MHAYELDRLILEREAGSKLYLEFLKVHDLSMGLYVLPAGSRDRERACRISRKQDIPEKTGRCDG